MSAFTGSLTAKRKGELVEIGEALGITDLDVKREEILRSIQSFLEANEAELSTSPRFKGLYGRRSKHVDSPDSDGADVKTPSARKSINKVIDRIAAIDPANVALPESPLSVTKAQVTQAAEAASDSLAVAIAPAKTISKDLTVYVNDASSAVVKFTSDSQKRIDLGLQHVRDHLSRPEHLVGSAIAVELGLAVYRLSQFYDHTVFFPPLGGEDGSIASLIHGLLYWAPSFSLTLRLPELSSFGTDSNLWPSLAWWFTFTVLPPLALSTVISSQIKHKTHAHNTRSQSHGHSSATPDPLSFALIRLAILLYPLTDAIPSSVFDVLESSGNTQLRAVGAGLLAAIIFATRLSA